MKSNIIISFLLLVLVIPFINAEIFPTTSPDVEVGFRDGLGRQGVNIQIPEQVLNVSNASVLDAEIWITNAGNLDDVNLTQMEDSGGELNILESWLKSFGSGLYWTQSTTQIGLTGDKTGTFNLETTGTGVFEGLNPYNSGTADLGSVGFKWRSLFLSSDANIGGNVKTTGTGRFDGGLLNPFGNLVIDLTGLLERDDGESSIDWESSWLIANGDIILDWSTVGLADFLDSDIKQDDDAKHFFGSSDDMSISFDGSQGKINAHVLSPTLNISNFGNVSIESDLLARTLINVPSTTSAISGLITFNGTPMIHNFGANGEEDNNVFFGGSGNFNSVSSIRNTGFGVGACSSLTTGDENFCFGWQAGRNIDVGIRNFALGTSTLDLLTEGNDNVAIGRATFSRITSGIGNIGIGRNAGLLLASSSSANIMIGDRIADAITGITNSNVLIGDGTLGAATSSGDDNVLIGKWSAVSSPSLGTRNVFLGVRTGNLNQGDENIFIGADAGRDETGSDTLIIDTRDRFNEADGRTGAIIYGLMNSNPILQKLVFNADVNISGGLVVTGNITSENVFVPQYVFSHTDETIPLDGANVWTNVTFQQEVDDIKQGITHNFDDETNTTYTINKDGIYEINFNFDMEDTSIGASDIDVAGRVVFLNGAEIIGSVFENDIIKQAVEYELVHTFLARLNSGDQIIFQFIADDEDVVISTHASFGDHPDSATIIIKKIANLK